jgi:hypothetical protein
MIDGAFPVELPPPDAIQLDQVQPTLSRTLPERAGTRRRDDPYFGP